MQTLSARRISKKCFLSDVKELKKKLSINFSTTKEIHKV